MSAGESLGYIAALDVGTTMLRCQIFDDQATVRGSCFNHIRLLYSEKGAVEINPEELWDSVIHCIKNAIKDANVNVIQIKSLAISTQRGTFITWTKHNGKPIHNFITWKDIRAADLTEQVNKSWKMLMLRSMSSLTYIISRYNKFRIVGNLKFTSSHVSMRLLWLLRHNKEVQKALNEDNLQFGTVDTWLLYQLTGGRTYVTDISNASATGLYDPFDNCWSFLNTYFNIPLNILPPVVNNIDFDFGETVNALFQVPIKIGALISDQSASMYGSHSLQVEDVKLTLGTGAFLNINTGKEVRGGIQGTYPLIGWKTESELAYLLEVPCSDAGSLIQWLLHSGLIQRMEELSDATRNTKDNGGVFFIPAFSGLGPPINDEFATSGFIGITAETRKEHMIRAVLESIIYRTVLAYNMLDKPCKKVDFIRVDGGVARNDFICQLLADLCNLEVKRNKAEMSTLGAAYLAGISSDFWKVDDIVAFSNKEDIFSPNRNPNVIQAITKGLKKWEVAAERFRSWNENVNNFRI
ncbi:hypothetical protein ABEB36_002555 [Hypothenemus hampei]|uniref:Glycerol kinase 5 n=1 Tax=Hypothenemus hampei TaxID=57062 RepID=A0ABD1F652_HYPHA